MANTAQCRGTMFSKMITLPRVARVCGSPVVTATRANEGKLRFFGRRQETVLLVVVVVVLVALAHIIGVAQIIPTLSQTQPGGSTAARISNRKTSPDASVHRSTHAARAPRTLFNQI